MNLQDFLEKSKRLGNSVDRLVDSKVYMITIIILVAFASYGLGRLSKIEESKPPIRLIDNSATANTSIEEISDNMMGDYVASKNGSKYHLPWCSGAQRIKEENKIWFDTKEAAERAGYGPAANCKGI